MSSNRIVVFSTLYVVGIGAYAYSVSNFALYEIFPRFVLVLLPILVLCWPVVLLKKNSPRGNVDKKTQGFLKDLEEEAKTKEKLYKKIKNQKKTAQIKIDNRDINEPGLMDKVKRLKSLYNNGTLTKDEFEKAKNKLLK